MENASALRQTITVSKEIKRNTKDLSKNIKKPAKINQYHKKKQGKLTKWKNAFYLISEDAATRKNFTSLAGVSQHGDIFNSSSCFSSNIEHFFCLLPINLLFLLRPSTRALC